MVNYMEDASLYGVRCFWNTPITIASCAPTKRRLELSEDDVRTLLHCPKGYRVKCDGMSYSPYTITDKEILDCDGDSVEYMTFICDLDGHEYELEKEPEVVEMTMEEICKALGKNIKIVKGDNE